jgi:hypothetical protein
MFLNEEFLSIYEELSEINDSLNESSFDNEEIYGEAAKTIPGLIRYFVAHIETLAAVIERERILASTGESKKPSEGGTNGKKLPFVSFSHQLFSHAYRRGSSWKYGVVVDQKKLEQKVETLTNTSIEDNYVHENKSSRVFGAARLSDGTAIIMTSYGQFEIDLNDTKRSALGDIPKTNYYEKVKASFTTRLEAEKTKYSDGHANSVTAESFYCTEVPEVIQKYLKVDTEVLEGFLLVDRRQVTGVRFIDICRDIPGLFEYLQDHTTLNEGELRVWLSKDEKYLDISGCIVGIVLPSNYKENNLDDEQNTAPDVIWLRKLIKEKNLTVYVYQSKDESNIPDVDRSKKRSSTLEKPSIMEYFHKITSSRKAAIDFIKHELSQYKAPGGYGPAYLNSVAKNTTSGKTDIASNEKYNYSAFLKAIQGYGLNNKDIAAIYKTGQPLLNAQEAFNEKTKSALAVQEFMQQLAKEYPNEKLCIAYAEWFANNTNAVRVYAASTKLVPASVNWNNFIEYCNQAFNYTTHDLTTLSKGQQTITERIPIKDLFKKAAGTNRKTTLTYIKNFAELAVRHNYKSLAAAYSQYIGKHASDSSFRAITTDTNSMYRYRAWLEKVTDPTGPIKLTKEEVSNYFKEYVAEAQNNN